MRLTPGRRTASDEKDLLLDVWGDTVSPRHLLGSIAIAVPLALVLFLVSQWLLATVVTEAQLIRAFAMLFGLVGCMAGAVIAGKLFRPKRIVVEEASDGSSRAEVLAVLAADRGGLGTEADLDERTAAEMRSLGLYEDFAAASATASAAATPPKRQPAGREG